MKTIKLQTEKLKLIEWLLGIKDHALIEKIKFLKHNPSPSKDWWDIISETEKQSIERGLTDIKNGQVTPHSEVRKKYAKWL